MPIEEIVEDIYQGIKLATQKGYSLRQAMISFHNSGYKKEDIEAAAQKFQLDQHNALQTKPKTTTPKTKPTLQKTKEKKLIPKPKQEVSKYGEEKPEKPQINMKLIISLIVAGILLIAGLAALLIFL